MKRKIVSLIILVLLLGASIQFAAAAALRFQVPQEVVTVMANPNGTATIEYFISFINDPGGDVIDPIDIGLPNNDFDLASVTAELNGTKINRIERQDSNPGITVWLDSNRIPAGGSGKVHVRIGSQRKLFYEGTAKESEPYASFEFSPNFFGSDYVHGVTDLTVVFFFPMGIQSQEPRYYGVQNWPGNEQPDTGVDNNGYSYYSWHYTRANSYSEYIFGATFPARLIPTSVIQKKPLIDIPVEDLIGYGICGVFIFFFGATIYAATVGARKRKLQYLPPKIAIEGMGIKRGLTAVEAAILMEQPMEKILTMILFSTIKKGAGTVTSKDPLKISITAPAPEGLNTYETDFLKAFDQTGPGERRKALQTMMINLVKSITEKMKGFSRKETIAYYTDIMKKAWEQVEAAQTPDVKMQKFDEQMDWTMLDGNFNDRTRNVFHGGPVYYPIWWGHYDPGFHGTSQPSSGSGSLGRLTIPAPNLPGADFAASMVNSVSSFASNAVGDVSGFTGAVTNQTNPVPVSTSSGSSHSGGGGHSCACACACAGCACACAGGGR